jgi:hypothetical protein
MCLIDPTDTTTSDPVVVGDFGIFCHRCAGKELSYEGRGKPGFVSFRRLVEGEPDRLANPLRNAVRGMAHWEHAKYVVGERDKDGYRALLKLWHLKGECDEEDEENSSRIDKVFTPSQLVRGNEVWLRSDTLTPVAYSGMEKLLACLPAVQYVQVAPGKKEGEVKIKTGVSDAKLGQFQGPFDLSRFGYPAIVPLRGLDIAARVRPFEDEQIYAVTGAKPAFRYRPKGERDMEKVEGTIRRCFPHVNLNALRLLIAAKGLVQRGDFNDVPQVYIIGQSGAGKSAHARLAAELACDRVAELRFATDQQKFLQSYASTSTKCSFALFNEATKSGLKGTMLRDFSLMFTKGIGYHHMYVGTKTIDQPAVVVMTDPELPDALRDDEQTARRIALIDLGAGIHTGEKVDWRETCETGEIEKWRAGYGNADVADAFVSDVIDRFFGDPSWTFPRIVGELGFAMLNKHADDTNADLRELYETYLATPESEPHSRWQEKGWRVFDKDEQTPLAQKYRDVTDGGDTQRIASAVWSRIAMKSGLTCSVRAHGRKVGLRFAVKGCQV